MPMGATDFAHQMAQMSKDAFWPITVAVKCWMSNGVTITNSLLDKEQELHTSATVCKNILALLRKYLYTSMNVPVNEVS